MSKLRILILEDVATDAELVERELRKAELDFTAKVVATREAFIRELTAFAPALILSDYSLPGFDGIEVLAIAKEHCPEVPFVFVSGAIGEELAIETLKQGATFKVAKGSRFAIRGTATYDRRPALISSSSAPTRCSLFRSWRISGRCSSKTAAR